MAQEGLQNAWDPSNFKALPFSLLPALFLRHCTRRKDIDSMGIWSEMSILCLYVGLRGMRWGRDGIGPEIFDRDKWEEQQWWQGRGQAAGVYLTPLVPSSITCQCKLHFALTLGHWEEQEYGWSKELAKPTMGNEQGVWEDIEIPLPEREYNLYSLTLLRDCEDCVFVGQGIVVYVKHV